MAIDRNGKVSLGMTRLWRALNIRLRGMFLKSQGDFEFSGQKCDINKTVF